MKFIIALSLFLVINKTFAQYGQNQNQNMNPICMNPPTTRPHDCCRMPKLISDEIKTSCGLMDRPPMGMGPNPNMGGSMPNMGGSMPNMGGSMPNMGGSMPNMGPQGFNRSFEYGNPHGHENRRRCDMNCAFEKLNLLSNGNINSEALTQLVNRLYTNEWASLAKNALQTCLSEVQNDNRCPTGRVAGCMVRVMLLACPSSAWASDNPECENVKSFITNCNHHN